MEVTACGAPGGLRVGLAAAASLVLTCSAAAQLSFSDETQSCGILATHQPLFDPGCVTWECGYLFPDMSGGAVVGDFNRDGWQDLFIVVSGVAPDLLFINNGDGSFSEQGAEWGVALAHRGTGAVVGDYNNDGWLDLFVTSWGPAEELAPGHHLLYRNEGGVSFTEVAAAAGVNQTSSALADGLGAAFGDYDLDGDLDLFVCGWHENNLGNRLFRNNGDGTFTDVTATAILGDLSGMRGFTPRFADMDGDRYPELLVAADYGTSRYLVNTGNGGFVDETSAAGTGADSNGMGQTVADFDGDGLLDWYVTSIHNDSDPGQTGNMLYINQGGHVFLGDEGSSILAGVNDGGFGWGTVAVDLDHDLDVDLVETNGWFVAQFVGELSKVFLNDGTGVFTEAARSVGLVHDLSGRGLMNVDYDNDGDQDLIFAASEGEVRVYRNNLVHTKAGWLRLLFDTTGHPQLAPDGFGTRVVATAGGVEQVGLLSGGCNYLSQSELTVHFGLGPATQIDELRVEWANGQVTTLADVPANQTLVLNPPALGDLDGDGSIGTADLLALLAAWGPCPGPPGPCVADLDENGTVGTGDLLILLARWG